MADLAHNLSIAYSRLDDAERNLAAAVVSLTGSDSPHSPFDPIDSLGLIDQTQRVLHIADRLATAAGALREVLARGDEGVKAAEPTLNTVSYNTVSYGRGETVNR